MESNDINSMKYAIQRYKEFNEVDEFLAYILTQIIEKMKSNCNLKESTEEVNNDEDNSIK